MPDHPPFFVESIGVIHSPFATKEACPIQPAQAAGAAGTVEIFPAFEPGLADIETFSHIHLIYRFDRAGPVRLTTVTFLDDATHGVFATRHPCRPNGLGMSVVRLLRREANVLFVEGLDVLDGTPLVDVKPYFPQFDIVSSATSGWTDGRPVRPKPPGRE
jgi:tRNA-Thr(GGU) m(6)t(6)A37 methyltransferase TsaA